jgi:hypothetical protein
MKPAAGRRDAQILISRPKVRTADSSSKNAVSFSSARRNETLSIVAMRVNNPVQSFSADSSSTDLDLFA